jgi:hypothetical protein
MTTETPPKPPWTRLLLMFMVLFTGLCTIFALVVTTAVAWTEQAESQWPQATARVDTCDLTQTSGGDEERYYIRCRLIYEVGAEQNTATVFSVNAPSRAVWQYPPNQIGPLEDWVAEHPAGTPIVVHYDPAHNTKAVLVTTDMPRGGPRTPANVKMLKVCAGSFVVLLIIARITKPRSPQQNGA